MINSSFRFGDYKAVDATRLVGGFVPIFLPNLDLLFGNLEEETKVSSRRQEGTFLVRSRERAWAVRKGKKGTRQVGRSQTDSKKSALEAEPGELGLHAHLSRVPLESVVFEGGSLPLQVTRNDFKAFAFPY